MYCEKKMNDKIIKIQNEMEEKVEALSIENEDLKKSPNNINQKRIFRDSSCSAGSLCIATTSLSSKVTFRSRLTKSIKS
jgi:hypothetical protein